MLFRSITLWLSFGTKKNYMLAGFTFSSLNYFLRYLAGVEISGSYIKIKIECKDTFWPVLLKVLYNFPKKEISWSLRHFQYFFFSASETFTQNNSTLNNTITGEKTVMGIVLLECCKKKNSPKKNKPKTLQKITTQLFLLSYFLEELISEFLESFWKSISIFTYLL